MKTKKILLSLALIAGISGMAKAGLVAVEKDTRTEVEKERDKKTQEATNKVWGACLKLVSSFDECKTLPQNCGEIGRNILDTSYEYIKECLSRVKTINEAIKGFDQSNQNTDKE